MKGRVPFPEPLGDAEPAPLSCARRCVQVHLDLDKVEASETEDPLDVLLNEINCQQLVEAARENNTFVEPCPLMDKKARAHTPRGAHAHMHLQGM